MSKIPVVTIESIKDSSNPNSTLKVLGLRMQGVSTSSNALSMALGNSGKGRYANFPFSPELLKELDLKVGMDINSKLQTPIGLFVSEVSESEFRELTPSQQNGYQPKINPSTNEYLVSEDAEYIYRKTVVEFTHLLSDKFVPHVGATSEAPSEIKDEVKVEDIPA